MKKFVIQAILLITVIMVSFFLYKTNAQIPNLPFFPQGPVLKQLQINNAKLKVEIADTQAKRSKGLGGRESLATDSGMLFIFPKPGKYPFWMKGLSFPLDFVWIKGDKVVDLLEDIQPVSPEAPDASLPIYQSKEEVDKVLEVPSGTSKRLDIKIGDTVRLEYTNRI